MLRSFSLTPLIRISGLLPLPMRLCTRSEEHTSELQSLMATLFPYTTLFRSHYILQNDAEELFAHTVDKNIWVATFTDALMYYSQWSTAKLSTSYSGGTITVNLTDSENDEVFDAPLTVKVTVPAKWTSAVCNGEYLSVETDDNGNKFVYVNIVPDSGAVEISQA